MPKIFNYDQASFYNGFMLEKEYRNIYSDSVAIQIFDINSTQRFPDALNIINRRNRFAFEFLDIDEGMDGFEEFRISDVDAIQIVGIIEEAKQYEQNVFVHCFAGVARSGAVVQYAVDIGFKDPGTYRHPNEYVLQSLKNAAQYRKSVL